VRGVYKAQGIKCRWFAMSKSPIDVNRRMGRTRVNTAL
jgi:hypothetical protein